MATKTLCIGWDLGGWGGHSSGRGQHFAALERHGEALSWAWFRSRAIPDKRLMSLTGKKDGLGIDLDAYDRIVMAIDAPLGFPKPFTDFLNEQYRFDGKGRETLYNELAFRETDRLFWATDGEHNPLHPLRFSVAADGKPIAHRPLSPTFQSFTNNVTVAMAQLRYWKEELRQGSDPQHQLEGLHVQPFDVQAGRSILKMEAIEVYPALMKSFGAPAEPAIPFKQALFEAFATQLGRIQLPEAPSGDVLVQAFRQLYQERVPKSQVARNDEADAAICALYAACYGLEEADANGLQPLTTPDDIPVRLQPIARQEGWIFHPRVPV